MTPHKTNDKHKNWCERLTNLLLFVWKSCRNCLVCKLNICYGNKQKHNWAYSNKLNSLWFHKFYYMGSSILLHLSAALPPKSMHFRCPICKNKCFLFLLKCGSHFRSFLKECFNTRAQLIEATHHVGWTFAGALLLCLYLEFQQIIEIIFTAQQHMSNKIIIISLQWN